MYSALRAPGLLLLLATVACPTSGCATPRDPGDDIHAETSESGIIGRVDGGSLNSAYAKPTATYLTKRDVLLLDEVGALNHALSTLARRVDGIIANQPPDERVSIDELLKIEQPGFIETLFPEEKAALPALWELLETTAQAPKNQVPLDSLPAIDPVDDSTPAGTLTAPAHLRVTDLPSPLSIAAQRVQLTHDDDGDPATISLADLNSALQNTQPYTPTEVEHFHAIVKEFTALATSSITTRVKMPEPFKTSKTLSAIGGGVKLRMDDAFVLRETRNLSHGRNDSEGPLYITIEAVASRRVAIEAAPGDRVIAIFESSEREVHLTGGFDKLDAGIATFEVWSNGERKSIERIAFTAAVASTTERREYLSAWANYEMTTKAGAPLFKNLLSASTTINYRGDVTWQAEYLYERTATTPPAGHDVEAVARLSTPRGVVAGRYEVDAGSAGLIRIDVSPSGVVVVTRLSSGASLEGYVHGPRFHVNFPDRLRVLLHGKTGELTIFIDGTGKSLFQGNLRPADRVG